MYRVRILVDGFVMGTTAYPKGSEMEVNLPVYNYLTAERKAELVDGESEPVAEVSGNQYNRRDMQAETPTAPVKTPVKAPVKAPAPAAVEIEAPKAKTKSRRGRPPGAKNKRKN